MYTDLRYQTALNKLNLHYNNMIRLSDRLVHDYNKYIAI